jgi:hypothetical protein
MILRITVTDPGMIHLDLVAPTGQPAAASHHFAAERDLSERLVAEIKRFLARRRVRFSQLGSVEAVIQSQRFSRQRTAAAVANALNFALHPKTFQTAEVAVPAYAMPARITLPHKKHRSYGI